jgi:hypothetical protein
MRQATCRCARGELHGPYLVAYYREKGKRLRKRYLGKADAGVSGQVQHQQRSSVHPRRASVQESRAESDRLERFGSCFHILVLQTKRKQAQLAERQGASSQGSSPRPRAAPERYRAGAEAIIDLWWASCIASSDHVAHGPARPRELPTRVGPWLCGGASVRALPDSHRDFQLDELARLVESSRPLCTAMAWESRIGISALLEELERLKALVPSSASVPALSPLRVSHAGVLTGRCRRSRGSWSPAPHL